MRVRAIKDGYYGDYRRAGDVFVINNPAVEFSAAWMQDAATPIDPRTKAADVNDELAEAGVKGAFATKLQGENERLKEQVKMLTARIEALIQPGPVEPAEAPAPAEEEGETPPEQTDEPSSDAAGVRRRRTPVR